MEKLRPTRQAHELLIRGSIALSKVEKVGVRVDEGYLNTAIKTAESDIRDKSEALKTSPEWKKVRRRFGHKANLGSRQQIAWLLFKELGYKPKHLTATGKIAADESSFDGIDLPFIKDYVQVEKLKKLLKTYLYGIRREVKNGKVHPSYNLNTAATYRSSCNDPNFQNIPNRIPWMAEIIRRCYIALYPHHHVGEMDYSQLEVRIAKCYHNDPVMDAYIRNPDNCMHRDTARDLFLLSEEQVKGMKKTARDSAKNQFVFPEFYGSAYFQCASHIWDRLHRQEWEVPGTGLTIGQHLAKKGITELGACDPKEKPKPGTFEAHVKKVETLLWQRFSVYAEWKKSWYRQYQRNGGFRMKTGFVVVGHYGRNDVINYPVQGAAFHCLLESLIRFVDWLEEEGLRTKVVGQIHDCMVLSIHRREVDYVFEKLRDIMTVDVPNDWRWINVPLGVEAELAPLGASWFDKKEYPLAV